LVLVTSRARSARLSARLRRWARRFARIVVAAFAIVALLGTTTAAQAFAAAVVGPAKCACEHESHPEPSIDETCRCCHGEATGLAGSCCSSTVAPAVATPGAPSAAEVGAAACVGLIDQAYESGLFGRSAALDLDRPPRA
jgi:hypothetical protein